MTLPGQLTGTFIEDVTPCGGGDWCNTSTLTNFVELGNTAAADTTKNLTLSHHQIDVTQAEDGEVGVGEGDCIGQNATVGLQVSEFSKCVATGEIADVSNLL